MSRKSVSSELSEVKLILLEGRLYLISSVRRPFQASSVDLCSQQVFFFLIKDTCFNSLSHANKNYYSMYIIRKNESNRTWDTSAMGWIAKRRF